MPIGKLRYFKPTSENIKDVAWKQYGWFRVCARKTGNFIYIFNNVNEFWFSRQKSISESKYNIGHFSAIISIWQVDLDSDINFWRENSNNFHLATGWQEQHPNGTFIPLVSSNFPNINNTIGKIGSSLVWHPAYPDDLYIVKDSISTSGNYWLMPLCYKPKPEIQVCETTKQSCCDNGDCVNGQCSCYAGFWAQKNCCCKEFSKY